MYIYIERRYFMTQRINLLTKVVASEALKKQVQKELAQEVDEDKRKKLIAKLNESK